MADEFVVKDTRLTKLSVVDVSLIVETTPVPPNPPKLAPITTVLMLISDNDVTTRS